MFSQEELSLNFMEYINCSENITCRLCLKKSDPLELDDIFNSFGNTTIASYITNFAEIPIDREDCFSKVVCQQCLKHLQEIEDFKKFIFDCHQRLKALYSVYSQNEEKSKIKLLDLEQISDTSNILVKENLNEEQAEDDLYEEDTKIDIVQHGLMESELQGELDNNFLNNDDVGTKINIKRQEIFKKEDANSKFSCNECGKICSSKVGRTNHLRTHKTQYYHCNLCKKKFSKESTFIKHNLVHTEDKLRKYKCSECGQQFMSIFGLKNHMEIHSNVPNYQCDVCGKSFRHPLSFKTHRDRHRLKMTEQKCKICNLIIRSRYPDTFKRHMKKHSSNFEKLCPKCGKVFKSLQGYEIHLRKHNGELEFKCDLCPKRYSCKKFLKQHINAVHNPVKRFHCEICGKSFAYKTVLNNHGKVHTKDNPFSCTMCEKKFWREDHFKGHMRVVHGIIEDVSANY